MAPKNLLALRAECVKRYNQAGDTTPREIASWIAAKTAIEIIDARIEQFDSDTKAMRKVFDTISDFAANAGIIVGPGRALVSEIDLRWAGAILSKNGVVEETGLAAGVLGHPAIGVAWLANKIAPYGEQLNAGDVVLAGSFTRPVNAVRGDSFAADYGPLGSFSFRFV